MKHRKRVHALAAATVLSLTLSSLMIAPAEAQLQAQLAAKAKKDKVNYGTTSWVAGTSGYKVTGKLGKRPKRKVLLQVQWADGWHTIDRAKTKRKGKFKIKGKLDWYGNHKVRVVAPKTRGARAKVFKAKKFKVATGWAPRGSASSYLRMSYQGVPFQWNPCKTVKYRINPGYAGEGIIPFTKAGVELLERATGIKTKYVGTTTAVPLSRQKYPKGTDMVIAWSHQNDYPSLVQAVGRGGPSGFKAARRKANNRPIIEIKQLGVTMNMAYAGIYPFAFEDPAHETMGLVLVHELGHAFGLDHFADNIQIMHPGDRPPGPTGYTSNFEAGDLAGLRAVGAQSGCLKPYRSRGGYSALDLSEIPSFVME